MNEEEGAGAPSAAVEGGHSPWYLERSAQITRAAAELLRYGGPRTPDEVTDVLVRYQEEHIENAYRFTREEIFQRVRAAQHYVHALGTRHTESQVGALRNTGGAA